MRNNDILLILYSAFKIDVENKVELTQDKILVYTKENILEISLKQI